MNKQNPVMQGKMAVIEAACGICSLPEDQLLARLEGLYVKGFESGAKETKQILESVSNELSKIVLAHLKRDPAALHSALEDLCKRHVRFVPANDPAKKH